MENATDLDGLKDCYWNYKVDFESVTKIYIDDEF